MRKKFFLLLLACLCATFIWSQTRQVTGKVMSDSSGAPLAGANVNLKSTRTTVATQPDGTFSITIPDKNDAILAVSYVGYTPKEISVGAKLSVGTITLNSSNTAVEVVVIGYQTVRKPDLLASSSIITSKELKDVPLNSTAEALQGRLAGVQITMSEGAPGADAVINIRGRGSITQSSEPLYVVDGIPMDNALSLLNPQDIETVNMLKDAASTAIYGSRGANGVFVITTKSGRNTNGKTIVAYNGFVGIQRLAQKIDMMDAYDFVRYQYERAWWLNDTAGAIKRYIGAATNWDSVNSYKNYPTFDWQERTMGRNALQSSHNVSVSGGNANTTYNLSLTAYKQNGILINSDLDRKNLNFKLDNKGNDRFRFGFNTRYTNQLIRGAGTSDARGAGANRLRQYTRYKPLIMPGEEEDAYDPNLDLNNAGNGFNI